MPHLPLKPSRSVVNNSRSMAGALVGALLCLALIAVFLRLHGGAPMVSRWGMATGGSKFALGLAGAGIGDPAGIAGQSAQGGAAPTDSSPHSNLLPQPYKISSEYLHYPDGRPHWGLDVDATYGIVQAAPVGGVVEDVYRGCTEGDQICGQGWGNHVWWKSAETGHHVLLAHFSLILDAVQIGATLTSGEEIGLTGATGYATGPHVHIQVNRDACCSNVNTINPAWELPWLRCDPEPVLHARFGAACP